MKYEVELKCLMDSELTANALPGRIQQLGYSVILKKELKQLNDYFINGSLDKVVQQLQPYLKSDKLAALKQIIRDYASFTVRARQNNNQTLFIVKATAAGESANHATKRVEFEEPVSLTFDELHEHVTASGFDVEARWQADRKIYQVSNGVTLDSFFTPGYGYVAEFEKVVEGAENANAAAEQLQDFLHQLGLEELNKQRLERMFAYYNDHWREYYGTSKVFTVE